MSHLPLVTGSNGRLGRALSDVIETEHAEELAGAVFATRDELDLNDEFRLQFELERIQPTVVINCAAYAHVDGCETKRELAERVNVEGARNLARAARAIEARIIHISTDLVFDGALRRPYREEDEPHPLSHYAVTKLAGEAAVTEENPDHVILRSSWFFGPWPKDRYPEVFLGALQRGERLRMVSDRLGSPTYLRDLARAITRLIASPYRGVLHFANAGEPTSRYHFIKELAGRLSISSGGLSPLSDREWSEDLAVRPIFSALDWSRYAEVTGHQPRSWMESLDEYLVERES
ncbi:MAG TPA: dTDP-4-dehydrorhamnose reductase [Candidatus Polarisedimenticolia bacterium]|nr:dTDP-4-dehydrorhamnose reductase [Candidatus Polarisedimenticolia bacterium]